MMRVMRAARLALGFGLAVGLSSCGIVTYPGQPGLVTDGYSKIDLEMMDSNGVWVYQTTYDNRPGQKGVGAIVTLLYPGATAFTSNTRLTPGSVVYHEKGQYNGAQVQAISIPSLNQIMLPTNSAVEVFLSYTTSLNEVDDRNLAEESLFAPAARVFAPLSRLAMLDRQFRFDLLKAGTLRSDGGVDYQITSLDLGGKKFTPTSPVALSTNLRMSSIQAKLDKQTSQQLVSFVEENYTKGFHGQANLYVQGAAKPVGLVLGVHTPKTAVAAGISVVHNATREQIEQALQRFNR